jgi:Domain of unknown function (DUF1877)
LKFGISSPALAIQPFQIQKSSGSVTLTCPHPNPLPSLGEGARNFTFLSGSPSPRIGRSESQDYPIHVLSPVKVNEITLALNNTSVENFSDRLNPIIFYNADLYPTKGWNQGDLDDLTELYKDLVDFFNCAMQENEAIVVRYI